MSARYIVGDVLEVLRTLPDDSVDLVFTSPPFLALRSYLPADHPDKGKEIGSEPTPGEFIDALLDVTEELARVLAPHGSLCFELGDTYSGSGGAGGDYSAEGLRAGQSKFDGSNHRRGRIVDYDSGRRNPGPGWPLDKSMCLIPELYRMSLVYGFNPLTGRETAPWRVRNVVRWHRPNPPVGALGDKWRPSTSDIVVACKSRTRFFDLDATRSADSTLLAVPSVSDALEVTTTLGAGDHRPARGWCDPGRSQIAIGLPVAWETQRLQVVEPVGFLVGLEQIEGPQVMDLESLGRPADPALVAIAVQRFLSGSVPIASTVGQTAAIPTGIVLASDIDAPPFTGTLETAEVVRQDLALVAGEWLAARITLNLNGARRTAFAIAPITGACHGLDSSSKYPTSGNGAPPLDTWVIPTAPYKGSHYATFPPALVVKPLLAMCPERVCTVCGEPSRRVTEQSQDLDPSRPQAKRAMELAEAHGLTEAHIAAVYATGITDAGKAKVTMSGNGKNSAEVQRLAGEAKAALGGYFREFTMSNQVTLGWTDCGHGSYRAGVILDPFAGSGTVLSVASGHGRDSIGIDLDERNAELARQRVGMFLTVEYPEVVA